MIHEFLKRINVIIANHFFLALVHTALVNIPLDLNYVLQFNQNIDEAINDAFGNSPEDFQGFWLR